MVLLLFEHRYPPSTTNQADRYAWFVVLGLLHKFNYLRKWTVTVGHVPVEHRKTKRKLDCHRMCGLTSYRPCEITEILCCVIVTCLIWVNCSVPVSCMLASNRKLSPSAENTGCGNISSHSSSVARSVCVYFRYKRKNWEDAHKKKWSHFFVHQKKRRFDGNMWSLQPIHRHTHTIELNWRCANARGI